ncbi:MAG: glycosyltransferase family 2 protein [Sulfolobales archaeon]
MKDSYENKQIRESLGKIAVVILNKDNAEGLRRALESLIDQSCPPCECFDIYVVDGGSRDRSREVFNLISRGRDCMFFIEQSIKGGTGPARREIIEKLMREGYRVVIWGDSENIYDRNYVREILERFEKIKSLRKNQVVIVSGESIVRNTSIWSHIFFWYHTYHQLFPIGVGDRHAPGNNKCEDIEVYRFFVYPPCTRSEDYIFSYYLYKNFRSKITYEHASNAIVYVSIPDSFRDVIKWQRARVKGLVECSRMIKYRYPPDLYMWLSFLLYNVIMIILSVAGFISIALFYLISIVMAIVFLQLRSYKLVERPRFFTGLLGYIGLLLHAFFTVYYTVKFSES